ncbi:MAG: lipid-A-disaccharide synthase [Gammaproteobacteria bacterium]|nr:lipid-A-disaccharide synthase [Gammaproteobacteria bacterium]
MGNPKTVFIVAGEASGDLHAANLSKELLHIDDHIRLQGMGGRRMREAGVEVLFDASQLAVVGIIEVLFKYRMIKGVLNQIEAHLRQSPPDLLILVDYQEFNQKLAAYAKSLGIKVLFYIGPQVWAWRPKRVYKMARIVDQMAVIFPFEVELYKKADVPVEFTGHPLVDENIPDKTAPQARQALALEETTTVGLFPGSRMGEIERLLPIMLASARQLRARHPELQFVLPLASSVQHQDLAEYGPELSALKVHVIENNSHDVIQACDSIMVASGTATLEIGLMGTPMVITHKVAALSYFILSRLVSISHIGLVNIVPRREIVREFIQNEATPENLTAETLRILEDENYNQNMRNELAKLRELLGAGGGSKNVARLAYSMLERQHDNNNN